MTFKPITSGKGSIINLPQLTTNSLISLNDSRITTKGEHLKVWGCCAYTNIFLVMDDGIVTPSTLKCAIYEDQVLTHPSPRMISSARSFIHAVTSSCDANHSSSASSTARSSALSRVASSHRSEEHTSELQSLLRISY